jgi:hypothetical protein
MGLGLSWLNDISDGLADQISTALSAVTDIVIHVESHWFETAELPAIDIYHTTDNGLATNLQGGFGDRLPFECFNIRLRVSPADSDAGQRLLYDLVDPDDDLSIIAALDADPTVGGLAYSLFWGNWGGISSFPDMNGDGSFIGELLPIKVVKAYS